MIYFKLIFAIISVVLIGIIFYYGYKKISILFQLEEKQIGKRFVVLIFAFSFLALGDYMFENFIPFNRIGIEFNSEREKLGIPKIVNNWTQHDSRRFKTYWMKPVKSYGHYKKVIEYGVLGPKYESDYYRNEKEKGSYVWSKYNFDNKSFEYLLFNNPNNKPIFVNEKGNFVFESDEDKAKIILKIDKEEFEKYITG